MVQPKPSIPGISRQMVEQHARQLFRDVYPRQQLTGSEWRLVEQDLARKLESDAL